MTERYITEINSQLDFTYLNLLPSERRESSEGDNLNPKRTGYGMIGTYHQF